MEGISRIRPLVISLLATSAWSARHPSGVFQDSHTRGMKQAALSPFVDVLNGASQAISGVISGVTFGTVKPGYYVNASDGTLTANANLNLNAPLSTTCCNVSFSESGGLTNRTLYASSQTGSIFPVAWPGWTGDIARVGNATAGAALGREVNGAQGTFFFGDHINNQTGQIQTDWYTISAQYRPNSPFYGYQFGNEYFNFLFGGGNVSTPYTGTATPVPNGVRRLLGLLRLL
eukprot:jgi/Botrbrau1/5800/Bobra.0155s0023.1